MDREGEKHARIFMLIKSQFWVVFLWMCSIPLRCQSKPPRCSWLCCSAVALIGFLLLSSLDSFDWMLAMDLMVLFLYFIFVIYSNLILTWWGIKSWRCTFESMASLTPNERWARKRVRGVSLHSNLSQPVTVIHTPVEWLIHFAIKCRW